jgi:hypothetical protein
MDEDEYQAELLACQRYYMKRFEHEGTMSVPKVEGKDMPEMLTIYLHACLMRLGGQQSFTIEELSSVVNEYCGVRIAQLKHPETGETQSVTLTLRLNDETTYCQPDA